MTHADQSLYWYRFYPGVTSSSDIPAIGPGYGLVADAFSGLRFDPKLPTPSTTSTAVSEETHKSFYELDEEQDLSFTNLETERSRAESQAAMRTANFAKLKRVPKIVGSVNHAIIPMPPVSHFVLLHCAAFGLLLSILSMLFHFTIITGRFCILVTHSLMLCYRVTFIDI